MPEWQGGPLARRARGLVARDLPDLEGALAWVAISPLHLPSRSWLQGLTLDRAHGVVIGLAPSFGVEVEFLIVPAFVGDVWLLWRRGFLACAGI